VPRVVSHGGDDDGGVDDDGDDVDNGDDGGMLVVMGDPAELSFDWGFATITPITGVLDPRNLATVASYAALLYATLQSIRRCNFVGECRVMTTVMCVCGAWS
jgi:hypothetical protein